MFYGLQFHISATVRYFTRSKTETIAKSKSTFLQICAFSWNIFFLFSEKKSALLGSNCEFSFFAHKGMYINREHFKWTPHGIKIFMKSHLRYALAILRNIIFKLKPFKERKMKLYSLFFTTLIFCVINWGKSRDKIWLVQDTRNYIATVTFLINKHDSDKRVWDLP